MAEMEQEPPKKVLKFTKINENIGERLDSKKVEDVVKEGTALAVGLPKVKFKLSDEEFKILLKEIDGKRLPISMLDDIFPYKIKRDKDGKIIGLPGGLDERSKRLGIRLSRSTYESPETGELFIKIDCNPMSEKEVKEFVKLRDERFERYQSKTSDDLTRVICEICKTRVQVGCISGELKVFCACDESPIDAIDITDMLDIDRVKKWKLVV